MSEEYLLKRGEVGSVLEFTLKDADGPVNLAAWTVTMTAKLGDDDPAILDAVCAIYGDQSGADKGKGTYIFDAETADIPAGTYKLEFKATGPGDAIQYFPKNKSRAYASLVVIDALS